MRKLIWIFLLCFMASIGIGVGAIIYANRAADQARQDAQMAIRESEQAWCEILNQIYIGQQAEPPQAESGIEFAKRIESLRARFGCV